MLGILVSHRFRPALLLVLVVGFIVALQVTPAFAATITVDSTLDGTLAALAGNGTCDLREAVQAANINANVDACTGAGPYGVDTIDFSGPGTITLTAGQLVVLDTTGSLTIQGPQTISGGNNSRVFLVGNDAVNDTIARSLTLNNIIVREGNGTGNSGGSPTTNGGCFYVRPNSTLTLSGSTVRDCVSISNGGGIYADEDSTVTVTAASLITNNTSTLNGGGINISTGFVTVDQDSCIQNNSASMAAGFSRAIRCLSPSAAAA